MCSKRCVLLITSKMQPPLLLLHLLQTSPMSLLVVLLLLLDASDHSRSFSLAPSLSLSLSLSFLSLSLSLYHLMHSRAPVPSVRLDSTRVPMSLTAIDRPLTVYSRRSTSASFGPSLSIQYPLYTGYIRMFCFGCEQLIVYLIIWYNYVFTVTTNNAAR